MALNLSLWIGDFEPFRNVAFETILPRLCSVCDLNHPQNYAATKFTLVYQAPFLPTQTL